MTYNRKQSTPSDRSLYRIYYDPQTGEILELSKDRKDEESPYLEMLGSDIKSLRRPLTKMIVKGEQLISKPPPPMKNQLPLKKSDSGFPTIKNNMIFIADGSTIAVEFWRKNDHSN